MHLDMDMDMDMVHGHGHVSCVYNQVRRPTKRTTPDMFLCQNASGCRTVMLQRSGAQYRLCFLEQSLDVATCCIWLVRVEEQVALRAKSVVMQV